MRTYVGISKHLMMHRHMKVWNDRYPWKRLVHNSVIYKLPAAQSWSISRLALHGSKSVLRRGFRTGIFSSSKQLQSLCQMFCHIGKTAGSHIWRQSAGVVLGAVCLVQKFDFENNGITDADVERCREANEVAGVKALIEATVTCAVCGKRQVLQEEVPGVEYCACKDGGGVEWERSYDGWQPFLEQQNILVWRRPHQAWPHLFAYKVYGRYDDVSLCAFVETQLSTSYRTKWDPSALDLHVLHSDQPLQQAAHETQDKVYSAQDLLYWLVKFPRFFANRDYVFKRRYRADVPRQEVVIVSEAAPPRSGVDEVSGVHRVHDYWSVMVVRARNSDFTQPGIEYVLSYFDNPGTSLPASITNFIASTAFPNFLKRLHEASLELQRQHEAGLPVYMSLPSVLLEAGRASSLQPKQILPVSDYEEVEEQLRKRGSTLDDSTIQYLMEALGEMVPSPTEDGPLMLRLDAMITEALDKLDERNPLVAKIKILKRKLDHFRSKNKIKREESLGEMKDLVFRHNRYEDGRLHPTPPVLVQHLFENMKEVLKADHDMRTGRGLLISDDEENTSDQSKTSDLLAPDSKEFQTVLCNEESLCHPKEIKHVQSTSQSVPDDTKRKSDICEKESESPRSWKSWLYSTLVEAPAGLFKTRPSDESRKQEDASDSTPNSKDTKTNPESDERGTENEPQPDDQSSSFWYYVYGWIFWPVVVKGQSSVEEAVQPEKVACDELLNELNDELVKEDEISHGNSSESRTPWYWGPVRGVSWIFSYFTNSKL